MLDVSYETPSFYVFFVFKKGVTALSVVSGMVVFLLKTMGVIKSSLRFKEESFLGVLMVKRYF